MMFVSEENEITLGPVLATRQHHCGVNAAITLGDTTLIEINRVTKE